MTQSPSCRGVAFSSEMMFLQASSQYRFSQDLPLDLHFALMYNNRALRKSEPRHSHLSSVTVCMTLNHLFILPEPRFPHPWNEDDSINNNDNG